MIGGGPDGRERISMMRSLMVGAVSFALTATMIAASGMQGASLLG